MKACILSKIGNPDNFIIKEISEPKEIGAEDVIIRHSSIGINFDDVMYRKGLYKFPDFLENEKNKILGFEGVGTIIKVGEDVKSFKIGDRVGYGFCPFGSYATHRVINYKYLLSIPPDISNNEAAATLRKGMLAESLLFKVFKPMKGDWVMIHSVVSGVGHLLAKLAKNSGLNVIGTVGDESKISIALATGCNVVINRKEKNMYKKVYEVTNGLGVRAVYDGVGKDVFDDSIECMAPFGLYVSYGYASGFIENLDIMKLRKRSLFFTAPMLELYKSNRYELIFSGSQVLEAVKNRIIVPNISRYTMDGIPQAHADLESGRNTGAIVIEV